MASKKTTLSTIKVSPCTTREEAIEKLHEVNEYLVWAQQFEAQAAADIKAIQKTTEEMLQERQEKARAAKEAAETYIRNHRSEFFTGDKKTAEDELVVFGFRIGAASLVKRGRTALKVIANEWRQFENMIGFTEVKYDVNKDAVKSALLDPHTDVAVVARINAAGLFIDKNGDEFYVSSKALREASKTESK